MNDTIPFIIAFVFVHIQNEIEVFSVLFFSDIMVDPGMFHPIVVATSGHAAELGQYLDFER